MATQIQARRDTETNWDAVAGTAVLAVGEIGLIVDQTDLPSKVIGAKVGDGNTDWGTLPMHIPLMSGVQNKLELDGSAATPSNATTTFLLKAITQQTGAVFGIEAHDSTDLLLSVDKNGVVKVSGGYGDTGLTISDAGAITTNSTILADGVIQSGAYTTTAGDDSGAQLKDNADHGQLLISSNSSSTPADDTAIHVNTNAADKFVVKYDGAISTVGAITSTGIVTCQGIVNSAAAITMGGQKITGLNTAAPTADGDAANKLYVDNSQDIGVVYAGGIMTITTDNNYGTNHVISAVTKWRSDCEWVAFNNATSAGDGVKLLFEGDINNIGVGNYHLSIQQDAAWDESNFSETHQLTYGDDSIYWHFPELQILTRKVTWVLTVLRSALP